MVGTRMTWIQAPPSTSVQAQIIWPDSYVYQDPIPSY